MLVILFFGSKPRISRVVRQHFQAESDHPLMNELCGPKCTKTTLGIV